MICLIIPAQMLHQPSKGYSKTTSWMYRKAQEHGATHVTKCDGLAFKCAVGGRPVGVFAMAPTFWSTWTCTSDAYTAHPKSKLSQFVGVNCDLWVACEMQSGLSRWQYVERRSISTPGRPVGPVPVSSFTNSAAGVQSQILYIVFFTSPSVTVRHTAPLRHDLSIRSRKPLLNIVVPEGYP